MELKYYKADPAGNITLLVTSPVPRDKQPYASKLLFAKEPDAEQIGFIEKPQGSDAVLRLQMMGGEFCGNASISAAALYSMQNKVMGPVNIEVSGMDEPVKVELTDRCGSEFRGSVSMPLPESVQSFCAGGKPLPLVRFPGISHIICRGEITKADAERNIRAWCRELEAEALGVLFIDGDAMTPYIYVDGTGTAVWEHSCASGTCALASYLALNDALGGVYTFRQPSGTLSADAVICGGELKSLTLHGSVKLYDLNFVSGGTQ